MTRWRAWLRQPDQFDAVTEFLVRRSLVRPVRLLMAMISCASALTPLSLLLPMHQPVTLAMLAVGFTATALSITMAWFWLTRWPTQRQSLISGLLGTVCVAAWSINQPSPALAMLTCTAAALTGGYLGFFHSTKVLSLNIVVGLAISVSAAVRLEGESNVATAASAFWVMWLINVAVPLAFCGTSRAMSQYATRSDEDPLTGLLNRRAFHEKLVNRLVPAMSRRNYEHLSLIMIDLDGFKSINDTQGHDAGDRVLVHVAGILALRAPEDSAICRAGGEEFLIAVTSTKEDGRELAETLCVAIDREVAGTSASVGLSMTDRRHLVRVSDVGKIIDELVCAADEAMYDAKRCGGNRIATARRGSRA